VTFLEMQTILGSLMNDPDEELITNVEKKLWLNLASLEEAVHTRILWATENLSGSDADYTANAFFDLNTAIDGFMAPIHIFFNKKELTQTSPEQLIEKNSSWPYMTGTPTSYFIHSNKLYFYPSPTPVASDGIRVHHLKKPVAMVADSSLPFNSILRFEPLHYLIVLRAAIMAATKIGDRTKIATFQASYTQKWQEVAWIVEDVQEGYTDSVSVEGAYAY